MNGIYYEMKWDQIEEDETGRKIILFFYSWTIHIREI